MRASFERVRKYGFAFGKVMMAVVLVALIGGISMVWAEHEDTRRHDQQYERGGRDRHDNRRRVRRPYFPPRRVYAPPPAVYYAPPPPPFGVTIFAPPIIIR